MAAPSTSAQPAQNLPGSKYSIPPFTDLVLQNDNNYGLTTVLSAANSVPVVGLIPFMQSDVVYGWLYNFSVSENLTQGAGATVTQSPYYPFQHFGPILLNMQYQYPSISVASGIDLAVINMFRPLRPNQDPRNSWYSTLGVTPLGPQASQIWLSPAFSSTVTVVPTAFLELPASVWFDSYYELDELGNPLSGPHNGYVSPQNMGGYARVITPTITMNPLFAATLDQGPFISKAGTTGAATGTLTSNFQRWGVLGSLDASVLPQPTNWQYNIAHQQVSLAGKNTVTIPLNQIFAGQIMGIFVRLFDPSAAAGNGGALAVTNVTNMQLTFGGNVIRFSGTVPFMQEQLAMQHLKLPPEGYIIFDLATDIQGWRTNSYLLNTLRTAAVQLMINFSAPLSATAYAEISIDGLRWVPLPINPQQ